MTLGISLEFTLLECTLQRAASWSPRFSVPRHAKRTLQHVIRKYPSIKGLGQCRHALRIKWSRAWPSMPPAASNSMSSLANGPHVVDANDLDALRCQRAGHADRAGRGSAALIAEHLADEAFARMADQQRAAEFVKSPGSRPAASDCADASCRSRCPDRGRSSRARSRPRRGPRAAGTIGNRAPRASRRRSAGRLAWSAACRAYASRRRRRRSAWRLRSSPDRRQAR